MSDLVCFKAYLFTLCFVFNSRVDSEIQKPLIKAEQEAAMKNG